MVKTPQEIKVLEKICSWKLSYETQIKSESEYLPDNSGTAGFRAMGCDKCDGFNLKCRKYSPEAPYKP